MNKSEIMDLITKYVGSVDTHTRNNIVKLIEHIQSTNNQYTPQTSSKDTDDEFSLFSRWKDDKDDWDGGIKHFKD